MFAFFGCNKAHGNPKMSSSHRQIVSVRGVLSHACLRKANWDIGMVTGFCHPPGIAARLPSSNVPSSVICEILAVEVVCQIVHQYPKTDLKSPYAIWRPFI